MSSIKQILMWEMKDCIIKSGLTVTGAKKGAVSLTEYLHLVRQPETASTCRGDRAA